MSTHTSDPYSILTIDELETMETRAYYRAAREWNDYRNWLASADASADSLAVSEMLRESAESAQDFWRILHVEEVKRYGGDHGQCHHA